MDLMKRNEGLDYQDFMARMTKEQKQKALDDFWTRLPLRLNQECNPFATVYSLGGSDIAIFTAGAPDA